jgi:hypothetical protein
MLSTRNVLHLLVLLSLVSFGCARKPPEKVAHGQDHNLFKKSNLLGSIESLDQDEPGLSLVGAPVKFDQVPKSTKSLTRTIKEDGSISFDVSESFVTVNRVDGLKKTPLIKFRVLGHWDLKPQVAADGTETQLLVKNNTAHPEWQKRAYVELDPFDVLAIKADESTTHQLYSKSALGASTLLWGGEIPIVSENPELMTELDLNRLVSLKKGALVTTKVTQKFLYFYAGSKMFVRYQIKDHIDLLPAKNANEEETEELVRDNEKNHWSKRAYVSVDPFAPMIVRLSEDLENESHKVLAKQSLDGCKDLKDLPQVLVEMIGKMGIEGGEICLELTQSILSIYKDSASDTNLIATVEVASHVDVEQKISEDGKDVSNLVVKNTRQKDWTKRQFVVIKAENPKKAENEVEPNALSKKNFQGEFIYTATVMDAHSENGAVFEGYSLQSTDRLVFEFSGDHLTAYKKSETLNNSGAKSPVLRYSIKHFDIGRKENSFGDLTNVTAELDKESWSKRHYFRMGCACNEIKSYFNDLLGVEKYYSGAFLIASPKMSDDIVVDGDTISWYTEETLTPNAAAGNFGSEENGLDPVSVRIKHVLLNLGKRTYEPKAHTALDFGKFGYFLTTKFGIDPIRGKTDDTLERYIRRFDISGKKHIDFYYSKDFPEKYKDEMEDVIVAWNQAFEAATKRKGVMRLLPNNGADHGDPRYNMLVHIPTRSNASPLGYGPSVFDPATGENISAKSYLYGNTIGWVLNRARDYFRIVRGETSLPNISGQSTHVASGGLSGIFSQHPLMKNLPKSAAAVHKMLAQHSGTNGSVSKVLERMANQATPLVQEMLTVDAGKDLRSVVQKTETDSVATELAHHVDSEFQGCQHGVDENLASALKFVDAHKDLSIDELVEELESRMVFTTMLHEVGHNLGLRHNFYGSFDETNFPDQYHRLKDAPAPSEEETLSHEWAEKYRGSTTMDYSNDFEAVYKFAGPYDVAAIKFGYGDKMERIVGQDPVTEALVTEDIDRAEFDAKVSELKAASPELSDTQADLQAMNTLQIRPYKFCTDGHVWEDPTCNRHDRGTTVAEITSNLIADFERSHFFNGFRRGRRNFGGGSQWVIQHYIMPVRQLFDEYVYNIIFNSWQSASGPGSQDDYLQALNLGFGFFDELLSSVEPGSYHLNKETGELESGRAVEEDAVNLVVDVSQGRYLTARSETIGGLEERIIHRGVELDKLGVLMAMSMRGYPARKYQKASLTLNYFDLLKDFTFSRFSSLMRDDFKVDLTIDQVSEGGDYVIADPTVPQTEKAITAKIKPSSSLTIQQYAALFAIFDYETSGDRTFRDYIDFKVKEEGGGFPEGIETVEFLSASGLQTYVVPNTLDGLSITFAMAEKAGTQSTELVGLRAEVGALPDLEPLKVAAIEAFTAAWEVGEGEPIPENILTIVTENFEGVAGQMVQFFVDWVESVEEEEAKAKLVELQTIFTTSFTSYTEGKAGAEVMTTKIEELERELRETESKIINLDRLYQLIHE